MMLRRRGMFFRRAPTPATPPHPPPSLRERGEEPRRSGLPLLPCERGDRGVSSGKRGKGGDGPEPGMSIVRHMICIVLHSVKEYCVTLMSQMSHSLTRLPPKRTPAGFPADEMRTRKPRPHNTLRLPAPRPGEFWHDSCVSTWRTPRKRRKQMNRTDLIKDAIMISGGVAYYVASTFYIFSKLASDYSLTLM